MRRVALTLKLHLHMLLCSNFPVLLSRERIIRLALVVFYEKVVFYASILARMTEDVRNDRRTPGRKRNTVDLRDSHTPPLRPMRYFRQTFGADMRTYNTWLGATENWKAPENVK